ncbi:hypothetical protein [Trichodesmium erythraeum]|uniref:hypothetical protein n=1 Tax=Trichodesmium erythraeum TaxID=1206 RepID=UPI00003C9EBB|nr:hypothetical protein [Trichodesmium erythraeum GBRTRLIN201]
MKTEPIKCNVIGLYNKGIALLFSKQDYDNLFEGDRLDEALNKGLSLEIDNDVTGARINGYEATEKIAINEHLRWLDVANSEYKILCNVSQQVGNIKLLGKCKLDCNVEMRLPKEMLICVYYSILECEMFEG